MCSIYAENLLISHIKIVTLLFCSESFKNRYRTSDTTLFPGRSCTQKYAKMLSAANASPCNHFRSSISVCNSTLSKC